MYAPRWLLTLCLVVTLLAGLAAPVQAGGEVPPPPGDPGGGPANPEPPNPVVVIPPPDEPEDAAAPAEVIRPPQALPDRVAPALSAKYASDDGLVSASGDPELGALLAPNITICPPGVLPTWWGGTGAGCILSATNDITSAIALPGVLTGWGVFAPANSYPNPVTITKSVNVIGEGAANTFINNLVTFMAGNATLSDFTIQSANTGVTANAGLSGYIRLQNLDIHTPGYDGIYIVGHKGNVELTNVLSKGNQRGATIDNSAGLGFVTINNSDFSNSTGAFGHGLYVKSKGAIKLDNVIADNNQGDGAVFSFGASLTIRNASFSRNDNADTADPYGFGICAWQIDNTSGTVSLSNVTADGNDAGGVAIFAGKSITWDGGSASGNRGGSPYGNGLYLESYTGGVMLNNLDINNNAQNGAMINSALLGATVTGSYFINNHSGSGLVVSVKGPVTLKYIFSTGNNADGILVDNSDLLGKPVNIAFINTNGNRGDGLNVISRSAVTLNTIAAGDNSGNGLLVDNCVAVSPGAPCIGLGGVTLAKTTDQQNQVINSGDSGVIIHSKGPVSLAGLRITNSAQDNLYIDACNPSSVTGKCQSTGAVTLTNIESHSSGGQAAWVNAGANILITNGKFGSGLPTGRGVELYTYQATTPRSITVNRGTFNSVPNGDGLLANAGLGALSLTDIFATANTAGNGAVLTGGAVTIATSTITANLFNDNFLGGLVVTASGGVTLKNTQASYNTSGAGVSIGTLSSPAGGAVTITNALFNNNAHSSFGDGLSIFARGALSLTNVTSKDNGRMGVTIANNYTLISPVTIKSSLFNSNFNNGLSVLSKGLITLDSVTAITNASSSHGAYLYNLDGTLGVNVLASAGQNSFIGGTSPGVAGLSIMSKGAVAVKNASVTNGLYVEGNAGVTLTDISTVAYGPQEIYVSSLGNIALVRVSASGGPTSQGALLDNRGSATPKTVTITDGLFANAGAGSGLKILSTGAVTLNNVVARGNYHLGALVDNTAGAAPVTILASGFHSNLNNPSSDGRYGLRVNSKGTITLKTVSAQSNSMDGISLDNCQFDGATCSNPLAANVIIVNTYGNNVLFNNGESNLLIMPKGSVNITGLISTFAIRGHGLSITSQYGTGDVTLNAIVSSYNGDAGFSINTRGRVSANNIGASYNMGHGFYTNNMYATLAGAKPFTLTNGIFSHNDQVGLAVNSRAAITLNHIVADSNGWDGVNVNNCDWYSSTCHGSGDVNLLSTLGPNRITNNVGMTAAQAGLAIITNGNVNIFKTDIHGNGFNGTPNLGSGVKINLFGNHTATITCSSITGNAKYGVSVMLTLAGTPLLQLRSTLVLLNPGGNFNLSGVTLKNLWGFCAY